MGAVAGKYSDLAILTSDNPRTEDPRAIMDEVEKGFKSLPLEEWHRNDMGAWRSKKGYLKVPDRREAIRMAIHLANLWIRCSSLAKVMRIIKSSGRQTFPFDDRVEAQKALEER